MEDCNKSAVADTTNKERAAENEELDTERITLDQPLLCNISVFPRMESLDFRLSKMNYSSSFRNVEQENVENDDHIEK